MTIDYHIFYACSHFLSVSDRKSRINSFSISNRFMCRSFIASSYCNCVSLLNCCMDGGSSVPSFRGLPFLFKPSPEDIFRWFRLCRLKNWRIFSYGMPNCSPIWRWLNPCSLSSNISFSYSLMCRYSLAMKNPPLR